MPGREATKKMHEDYKENFRQSIDNNKVVHNIFYRIRQAVQNKKTPRKAIHRLKTILCQAAVEAAEQVGFAKPIIQSVPVNIEPLIQSIMDNPEMEWESFRTLAEKSALSYIVRRGPMLNSPQTNTGFSKRK
ncbi:MAG: hypothetical protein VXZ73_00740 [Pseudomonadota bacterium]|nr:hypothetical protein [Pseudomonadota bacterium]MEC8978189.1 hypothetical protein [Pseudomonadota bacterium]